MFGVRFIITSVNPKFTIAPFRPAACCCVKTQHLLLLAGNGEVFKKEDSVTWRLV